MVDVNLITSEDGQEIKVESNKTEKALIVYNPQDGFKFYAVKYESGAQVPEELNGRWTGSAAALKAVMAHLELKKTTPRKAVNDRYKAREAKKEMLNATEPDPENS
jgi:hypothetical protein|tara:strand:+ start:693 stop:1010 length:318 start_codon:yes stop_codon:yes gene_type:complete